MSFWARPSLRRAGYLVLLAGVFAMLWFARASLLGIWREHLLTFVVVAVVMAGGLVVQVKNFLGLLDWPSSLALRPAAHAWALATLLNYLGPFQPGLALRVAYFKSQGVPVRRTAEATLRQLHLSFWTALLAAAFGLALLGGRVFWIASVVLVVCFFLWPHVLGAARPWLMRFTRPSWLVRHLGSLEIVITPLPMRSLKYFLMQHALGAGLILYSYRSFGSGIGAGEAILISVGVYTSSLVAVLPNNLGILDALYIATAQMGGLSVTGAVALTLLLRGAHIVMCVVVGICTWRPSADRATRDVNQA